MSNVNIITDKILSPEPLKVEFKKVKTSEPTFNVEQKQEVNALEMLTNMIKQQDAKLNDLAENAIKREQIETSILEKFYTDAKQEWINYGNDINDFDWDVLIEELYQITLELSFLKF